MTEQEWRESTEPMPMLTFLQVGIIILVDELPSEAERQVMRRFLEQTIIPRKLALFACVCCRQIWQVVTDERSRKAVEIAEQSIDGLASDNQLWDAAIAALEARNGIEHKRGDDRANTHICRVAANACWEAWRLMGCARGFGRGVMMVAQESADVAGWIGVSASVSAARATQAQFLRCIVANPFRLATVDSAWLSWAGGSIPKLAQTIYEDRVFDRLPVLANLLAEAGCTNQEILTHLRSPGPHVLGCFALDLLLGKA